MRQIEPSVYNWARSRRLCGFTSLRNVNTADRLCVCVWVSEWRARFRDRRLGLYIYGFFRFDKRIMRFLVDFVEGC